MSAQLKDRPRGSLFKFGVTLAVLAAMASSLWLASPEPRSADEIRAGITAAGIFPTSPPGQPGPTSAGSRPATAGRGDDWRALLDIGASLFGEGPEPGIYTTRPAIGKILIPESYPTEESMIVPPKDPSAFPMPVIEPQLELIPQGSRDCGK